MKQYIVFSHGQESGPWGTKISSMSKIAEKMQCKVISVDYRGIIDPEDRINKLIQECSSISDPIILVGSSMGGFVATVAASKIETMGLFVLAPAFFMDEFDNSLIKPVSVPIEIIHGWNDDVVPVENSIRFAEYSKANLHILNSDHGLTDNLDNINCIFENFIERCSANRKL